MAGLVKRYHTWPTTRVQTIAEHSWQIYRIYQELFGAPDMSVAYYIQWHDAGELVTGDLPFGEKSRDPELKKRMDAAERSALLGMNVVPGELDPDIIARVKLCDLLEMWEFGMEEIARGNTFARPVVDRTAAAVDALCGTMPDRPYVIVREHKEKVLRWTT